MGFTDDLRKKGAQFLQDAETLAKELRDTAVQKAHQADEVREARAKEAKACAEEKAKVAGAKPPGQP